MKPLYLEIEGVKSISEMQSVNFERVSKSGIFGIFGKTGSGKTTSLDSIVLAIYGDTTASIDNKDFVNSGCNQARVMRVFSILTQGERTVYKVERTYKFDKKETIQCLSPQQVGGRHKYLNTKIAEKLRLFVYSFYLLSIRNCLIERIYNFLCFSFVVAWQ